MRFYSTVLISLIVLTAALHAQSDSLLLRSTSTIDSTIVIASDSLSDVINSDIKRHKGLRKFWRGDYPNPKKALFIALAVPGAGQIYNKKYWKTPIFYAGMGTLIAFEVDHVRNYREFKRNYKAAVDEDPTTIVDFKYSNATDAQLKSARDQRQVWMEYTAVGMGLLYLFAVADAYVDAHLASFDVSDDLSLRLQPHIESQSVGLGLALTFK